MFSNEKTKWHNDITQYVIPSKTSCLFLLFFLIGGVVYVENCQ